MRTKVLFLILPLLALGLALLPGQTSAKSADYVVVLKDGVTENPATVAQQYGGQVRHVYTDALKGYAATLEDAQVAALRQDARVQFVQEDGALQSTAQSLPTGVDRVDADTSTTRAGNGSGTVPVNVGVIDIGIQTNHPDLNVVATKSCTTNNLQPWHGTAVAGALAARDNAAGVVGVAPGANLYNIKLGDFWMTRPGFPARWSEAVCAVDYVTSTRTDKSTKNDIKVVNMSFLGDMADDQNCGNTNGDSLHKAICRSVAAGVTYVAAAGNNTIDFQSQAPASYDEVLTVTAISDSDGKPGALGPNQNCTYTDPDDVAASFSNYATLPADIAHTIAAPGTCITTTADGSKYAVFSGTSLATPHVTGAVALCIASGRCNGLTPAQIIQKIRTDAEVFTTADPAYGFAGDPTRPVEGRYYGYLLRAGLY